MSEILKNLELVEVSFEDEKATLTFLDEAQGEIREVYFNKKVYKDGKYVADPEKAKQVEEWCQEYFKCTFEDLKNAVGDRKDIYVYDRFNSLWEVDLVEKFEDDMTGQIFETKIESIEDNDIALVIKFKYEGNTYQSKMTYAKYMEERKEWFPNPQQKKKQFEKFKEKFKVDFSERDQLIGKKIMVEVKKAFGKFTYADIKPLKK